MGLTGCVVPNCVPDKEDARHRFPNPKNLRELCEKWLRIINNIELLDLDLSVVYKKYRVCDKHFVAGDHTTNNRLKKETYPKLHIPSRLHLEHTYCKPLPGDSSANELHVDRTLFSKRDYNEASNSLLPSTSIAAPNLNTVHYTESLPSTRSGYIISGQEGDEQKALQPETRIDPPIIPGIGLSRNIGVCRSSQLSPVANRIYKQALYYKKKVAVLLKKRMELKRKIEEVEQLSKEKLFQDLTKNFTPLAYKFFKGQVESFGKKSKGRRFDIDNKIIALALYKQSPTAYRLLSALFILPSRVTLQKLLARIPISPGIHETVFNTFSSITRTMKPHDKYCLLLFDEMSLEPNLDEVDGFEDFGTMKTEKIANHVQVYMLRGIASNWKQPVGYFLVNGGVKSPQIKENIINIIRKARQAGLIVVGTVCDQGSNNESAINSLVTGTQNKTGTAEYIFEVDNEMVVPLFDVPHLLKSLRNILLYRDIHFINKNNENRIAKWDYIQRTWELDNCSGDLRALPKLTEYHINKSKVKKFKVSVAAQVFSHSLAATMNLLIYKGSSSGNGSNERRSLNEEARGTVDLLKFIDDVFDSLNSSARKDTKGKALRTSALTGENSIHDDLWRSAIQIFDSMYVMENGRKKIMPYFKNWGITLSGFRIIRKKLNKCGFTRVKTRRFNQDPLENLFGRIRRRGQRFTKPTCRAFDTFYKSLLVNGLVSKHSVGANCEVDKSNVLFSLQRFITQMFVYK